jgi:hypothetical protein
MHLPLPLHLLTLIAYPKRTPGIGLGSVMVTSARTALSSPLPASQKPSSCLRRKVPCSAVAETHQQKRSQVSPSTATKLPQTRLTPAQPRPFQQCAASGWLVEDGKQRILMIALMCFLWRCLICGQCSDLAFSRNRSFGLNVGCIFGNCGA